MVLDRHAHLIGVHGLARHIIADVGGALLVDGQGGVLRVAGQIPLHPLERGIQLSVVEGADDAHLALLEEAHHPGDRVHRLLACLLDGAGPVDGEPGGHRVDAGGHVTGGDFDGLRVPGASSLRRRASAWE